MAMRTDKGPDLALIGATLSLLFFGLVMVYSSSSIMAEQRFGSQGYFLVRQAAAVLVGLGVLVVLSRVRLRLLEKIAVPFLIVSVGLLVAVLIPGVGVRVGGAQRWIHLPGFNVQPA